MRVIYDGPFRAVTLADGTHFPCGEGVDVPQKLAKQLLRQDTFKKVTEGKTDGSSTEAGNDEQTAS